ncbi:hypothetical protein LUZ60_001190 [Juncus effusus]|nr:hypothetical protein LUZ60_001190 [Juncus effusus]
MNPTPSLNPPSTSASDPLTSVENLSALGEKMECIRRFLSDSLEGRAAPIGADQLQIVSSEISSAVQHVILNATTLLASVSAQSLFTGVGALPPGSIRKENPPPVLMNRSLVDPLVDDDDDMDVLAQDNQAAIKEETDNLSDCEIIEMDAEEILAEHIHQCEVCGKSFKRDANLRMHMRAHGNQFKTLEALSRPGGPAEPVGKKIRFSCPYPGCNRNKAHKKFRPLKSAICVRNHFKRSHCPKMYNCQRCGKKSFAVLADLKSHLRHCGETPWRCSCGTTFSRKDKLFGHLALFEGHQPDTGVELEERKGKVEKEIETGQEMGLGIGGEGEKMGCETGFFDGIMEELEGFDGANWQETYMFMS